MRQRKEIVIAILVCIFFGLNMVPIQCYGGQEPARVIRVGSAGIKGFIETEQGVSTGYGVEYLNEIAKKTGWTYTYVPGSWSECVQRLQNGEIDLLLPAEQSPEREKQFVFSKIRCCVDYVGLYTLRDRKDLYFEDYAHFDGLRVGLIQGNCLNDQLFRLAKEKKFTFVPIYYNKEKAVDIALKTGEVDAVLNGNLGPSPSHGVLSQLGLSPAYFMMTKKNQDLMDTLDDALEEIQLENPYFEAKIYKKYYGSFDFIVENWTRKEAEFIRDCPPLRVVSDADSNPIEWYDAKNDEYKGIYVEILRSIAKEAGLTFQFVSPKDLANPWKAVESGEGDLLSAAYGNEVLADRYDMCFSTSYYPEENSIVGRRGDSFNPKEALRISLLDSYISTQAYIKEHYPQWQIIPCDNLHDCMEKVANGQADITMTDAITLPYNNYLGQFSTLAVISTTSLHIPMGIGIAKNRNFDEALLQSVLNKAILRVSEEEVDGYVLRNTIERVAQVGLSDLIRRNPGSFVGVVIALLCILAGVGLIAYGNRLKTKQNERLEEKNVQLKSAVLEAEHARDLYDALYNMAVCGIAQLRAGQDGHLIMQNANDEAETILNGRGSGEQSSLIGIDLRPRIHKQDYLLLRDLVTTFQYMGDRDSIEFRILRSDQKMIWVRATIELVEISDDGFRTIQSTFMDVTERKELEQRLKTKSERDSLTGLYNKGAMEQYTRAFLCQNGEKVCAYIILDIDNFKEVNDNYGHWIGDGVLKETSQVIRNVVHGKGLMGRFGGDEFVIFFGDIKRDSMERMVKLICTNVRRIEVPQMPSVVSCSIGAAVGTGYTYEELFETADVALYEAKQGGKDRVCVKGSGN